MACLEMYNSSPRISFSYDFVDPHQFTNRPSSSLPPPPASSDFEFSASNNGLVCADMICADELFSKGKLLPFKYSGNNKSRAAGGGGGGGGATMTLRDELLTGHHDDEISTSSASGTSFPKPPKNSGNRWKGFLGLRRSHTGGSKKPEKTDGCDSAGLSANQQPKSHGHPRLDFDSDPLHNMASQVNPTICFEVLCSLQL
uniref:Uncharacterized protein n=1 Tax=Kalanchoe fedtschenkoi TaxID=63787 RepID=A0A7N0VGP5_KALFE